MTRLTDVRLTVLGAPPSLHRFQKWNWPLRLKAKYIEVFECSPERRVWWFQTLSADPHVPLRVVSSHWPELVFLLEYENQRQRTKGLARAQRGKMDHCRFTY